MRIAVIGAGPSGFFTAGELFKKLPGCDVHMFEKRTAPYGLVKFGVAPDHTLTRRVTKMFDQIAGHERFSYFGNVDVGKDLTFQELQDSYHAVIVCTGAEQPNRPDIPGSQLPGVVDALDFSWWVNGGGGSFSGELLKDVDTAIVVGIGNVALDVARMLARPVEDWDETDIVPEAKEALENHRIKNIKILGRRGPLDAAFTEAELEEVLNLRRSKVSANHEFPFELKAPEASGDHTIEFLFHTRPERILGNDRVEGVEALNMESGEETTITAELVFFATGHRAIPIGDLPLNNGVVSNDKGRVTGKDDVYVCGWIKRGAKGLIGNNRKDAIETVSCIVEDMDQLAERKIDECDWAAKLAERNVDFVTWPDWRKSNELG